MRALLLLSAALLPSFAFAQTLQPQRTVAQEAPAVNLQLTDAVLGWQYVQSAPKTRAITVSQILNLAPQLYPMLGGILFTGGCTGSLAPGGTTVNLTGCGGGGGSLTSIGLIAPAIFTVSPSTLTSNGNFTIGVAATQGGIPYFPQNNGIASSAALTPNVPILAGALGSAPYSGSRSGNTTTYVTASAALTNGNCLSADANGNVVPAGGPCTVGGGGGTVSSGTGPQIAQYSSGTGTTVVGVPITGDLAIAQGGAATVSSIGGKSVALGGALSTASSLTFSGGFPSTITFTGSTGVTFPTTGTLLTAATLPQGTNSAKGVLQCDGTTTTCSSGVISASSGGGGSSAFTVRLISSGTSDTSSDTAKLLMLKWTSTSAAAKAETLPTCASGNAGYVRIIKDGANTAGTYAITVTATTGTIDGGTSATVNKGREAMSFMCDGAGDWSII